jgi:hypothetical protein
MGIASGVRNAIRKPAIRVCRRARRTIEKETEIAVTEISIMEEREEMEEAKEKQAASETKEDAVGQKAPASGGGGPSDQSRQFSRIRNTQQFIPAYSFQWDHPTKPA